MANSRHLANAVRALSMDAVQAANSGHPGAPMGMADIAEVLWNRFLKHNPNNPDWADRDRFVLSNGHGSMLIYSLLHLSGYDLDIQELKNFRQLHSKTPGHPEYGYAPGIETTTGPLGQGITNAVGMALAEKMMAAQFNRESYDIVDHYTYVFLGDGCLMEGISHEACSLAGTWKLGKLIAIYDDNNISIDGEVGGWFGDDTPARFESYGWHVIRNVDGHDAAAVEAAIEAAREVTDKPTLICAKTVIGFGSPNKQGTSGVHGAPLGADEIAAARKELGWEFGPFEIPTEVYEAWDAKAKGESEEDEWNDRFADYEEAYPELAAEFRRRMAGDLPENFEEFAAGFIATSQTEMQKVATRKASQICLNSLGPVLPEMVGGSADLAGSNLTMWDQSKPVTGDDASGNYLYYGVREFGMSAIMNGIALHGGFIPYGGTFLMFMEYARNAVRMAALMKQRVVFVYTHDSIGLGEDGPTHQPVEQLSALRATPNLETWRPCDVAESAVAWTESVKRADGPSTLIFTRQGLEPQVRDEAQVANVARGGYVLADCDGKPDLILIATGSEVALAMAARAELSKAGHQVRVVSMPCCERFDKQDAEYREGVLPSDVLARVAIEAAHKDFWFKYVGLDGRIVAMESFGESAPAEQLFEMFGFTVENVVATAQELVAS
ncbi:MAG: transketolase [Gammaproteobacteria bacterium]|nr:transketolase [Gammaproteobacteria bacterium]